MARKFVLIPEDMYKSLLNARPDVNKEQKDLDDVLSSRLEASAKNVLYNNKLQNLIKRRKENEEKPLKVEVVKKRVKTESEPKPDLKQHDLKADVKPQGDPHVEEEEEEDLSPLKS